MARERAGPSMLGCVIVFGLLLGGVLGCGLGLGFLLHWLIPAMDIGLAMLSGLVATGVTLWTFGQLMTFAEPDEALPPVWRLPPLPQAPRMTRRPRKRP